MGCVGWQNEIRGFVAATGEGPFLLSSRLDFKIMISNVSNHFNGLRGIGGLSETSISHPKSRKWQIVNFLTEVAAAVAPQTLLGSTRKILMGNKAKPWGPRLRMRRRLMQMRLMLTPSRGAGEISVICGELGCGPCPGRCSSRGCSVAACVGSRRHFDGGGGGRCVPPCAVPLCKLRRAASTTDTYGCAHATSRGGAKQWWKHGLGGVRAYGFSGGGTRGAPRLPSLT